MQETHETHETHGSDKAPEVPSAVVDEAKDSPGWLPFVGAALLVLVVLMFAMQHASGSDASHGRSARVEQAD